MIAAGTLTTRQLNRASLARQMLLERASVTAQEALERLAGLQAQWSTSPYISLWSRVRDFRIADLESLLHEGRAVKATLMRGTQHLVTRGDFAAFCIATREQRHARWVAEARQGGLDVDRIRQAIQEYTLQTPRTRDEILDKLVEAAPGPGTRHERWQILAEHGDLVHASPGGDWRYWGGPLFTSAGPLLGECGLGGEQAYVLLVRRYLGAFGPAARADLATWSGQPMKALAAALATLEPELVTFEDEQGRTLYDLADAPRPSADTPAPVRFLGKWDNLILGYDDRSRVLEERHRSTIIRANGDMLPPFLVDGTVAGSWSVSQRGKAAILRLATLRGLSKKEESALTKEGEALLRFYEPGAAHTAVELE